MSRYNEVGFTAPGWCPQSNCKKTACIPGLRTQNIPTIRSIKICDCNARENRKYTGK